MSETRPVSRTQSRSAKEGERRPIGMRPVLSLVLLLSLFLAGCHEPTPEDRQNGISDQEWEVRGTFTENATQEDIEDLRTRLEPYDGELFVLESFPMQYQITGPEVRDCPDVEEMLRTRVYIADVGTCTVTAPATEPAEPAASPAH